MSERTDNEDLVRNIAAHKIQAYELLRTIVRGDINPKNAGYASIEHAARKIFGEAEEKMERLRKNHEKKYPHPQDND